MILYVPTGTSNLKAAFPALDWDKMGIYFVEIKVAGTTIATSPTFTIDQCKNTDDEIRIHFLNQLGTIDAINLHKMQIMHENKSEGFERPRTQIFNEHAMMRNGVTANDYYAATYYATEDELQYIDELLDSPMAWAEWKGTEGQPDDYIPIVIADSKNQKYRLDDRYEYEVTVEFKFSRDKIVIRG